MGLYLLSRLLTYDSEDNTTQGGVLELFTQHSSGIVPVSQINQIVCIISHSLAMSHILLKSNVCNT